MLELDLILGPFIEKRFKLQSERIQQLYVQLLAEEDQDLFRWLLKAEQPKNTELVEIIELILRLHLAND